MSNRFSLKKIPVWAIVLAAAGVLYATGLHTEALGQLQRLLLATGIRNADMPPTDALAEVKGASAVAEGPAAVAGSGFALRTLDGKTVPFDSFHGKVVFLNMWATWCPPCIAEMPNIQKLYEKVGSDKIAFVMLALDEGGVEKVQHFIDKRGFTFPVYLPAGELPQEFYTNAIPTTFIISPEGKIVAHQEGMADYNNDEVQDFLTRLAKK